jgi:hypothetical protein
VVTGFLPRLRMALRVPRGRAGLFIGLDFVLMLLLYAVSAESSIQDFRRAADSVSTVLAGLWQRALMPSRYALSRFLKILPPQCVAAVEALFFQALLDHGLRGDLLGGIRDRDGQLTLCFDCDGTRGVARLRALVSGPQWPAPLRRLLSLCQPGYTGRKRGEVVRTRSALMQAHTQEWLGTWAAPGNGDAKADLDAACERICAYLRRHGLALTVGLMRLDGLYGTLPYITRIAQRGLGWLTRCTHYALLKWPEVRAAIARGPVGELTHPESGVCRELFDLPALDWHNTAGDRLTTRLVITRYHCEKTGKPSVGVRRGK